MRLSISRWLGKEFVALSAEGPAGPPADQAASQLLRQFETVLGSLELTLEHTVRTRLWARDRDARDRASLVRPRLLGGSARSASSSYISPGHFDSEAGVGFDLWAMRPGQPSAVKLLVEYDPPAVPLRYLVYEEIVFLSGVTHEHGTLTDQLASILPRIQDSLRDAGSSWERVVKAACFLHRGQNVRDLQAALGELAPIPPAALEYSFVDGYSRPGKLIEIEVTAVR